MQRDMMGDDRGCDGSSLGSLIGSNNEIQHYSFKPSKQIVSLNAYCIKLISFSMTLDIPNVELCNIRTNEQTCYVLN